MRLHPGTFFFSVNGGVASAVRPERPFDLITVVVRNIFDCSRRLYRNTELPLHEVMGSIWLLGFRSVSTRLANFLAS